MASKRGAAAPTAPRQEAPRVFLSYRRDDSADHAAFLQAALERRLGPGSVFRDLRSIDPGDRFAPRLEAAIRQAAVVLVLIGPHWLDARDAKTGKRRLDLRQDFVRREVELALEYQRHIVPVLLEGAKLPAASQLPLSMAPMVERQALALPWHEPVDALAATVREEAERLAVELNVPIGPRPDSNRASSRNAALHAMRSALLNMGAGLLDFDADELDATMTRLSDPYLVKHGGFQLPDLIYAIDMIGVKLKRGTRRYVARSRRVPSIEALVECLDRRQTVLVTLRMLERWLRKPALTKGVLDPKPSEPAAFGMLGVVSRYRRTPPTFTIHLPFVELGAGGALQLSRRAAESLFDTKEMFVIEPALMPRPLSEPALEDYSARLPAKRRRPAA